MNSLSSYLLLFFSFLSFSLYLHLQRYLLFHLYLSLSVSLSHLLSLAGMSLLSSSPSLTCKKPGLVLRSVPYDWFINWFWPDVIFTNLYRPDNAAAATVVQLL